MLKHHQIVQNADVYFYDYESECLVKGYIQSVGDEFHTIAQLEPKTHYGFYTVKATEALYKTPDEVLDHVLDQSLEECSHCREQIQDSKDRLSRYTKRANHVQKLLSKMHKKEEDSK